MLTHVIFIFYSGMKPSERAKAEHSYEAKYPNELSFVEGDIITILSKHVSGIDSWWEGEANGKIGIFPSSFVELLPAEEENTSVTDKVIDTFHIFLNMNTW